MNAAAMGSVPQQRSQHSPASGGPSPGRLYGGRMEDSSTPPTELMLQQQHKMRYQHHRTLTPSTNADPLAHGKTTPTLLLMCKFPQDCWHKEKCQKIHGIIHPKQAEHYLWLRTNNELRNPNIGKVLCVKYFKGTCTRGVECHFAHCAHDSLLKPLTPDQVTELEVRYKLLCADNGTGNGMAANPNGMGLSHPNMNSSSMLSASHSAAIAAAAVHASNHINVNLFNPLLNSNNMMALSSPLLSTNHLAVAAAAAGMMGTYSSNSITGHGLPMSSLSHSSSVPSFAQQHPSFSQPAAASFYPSLSAPV